MYISLSKGQVIVQNAYLPSVEDVIANDDRLVITSKKLIIHLIY